MTVYHFPANLFGAGFIGSQTSNFIRTIIEIIKLLGLEIHLNITGGRHSLIACGDIQTSGWVHQEIEFALDLDKMHLFEKDFPNLRIKTE